MSDNARMQLNHIAQKLDARDPKWYDIRTCRRPDGRSRGRDRYDRRRSRSRGRRRSRSRSRSPSPEYWEVEGSFEVNGKIYKAIGRAEWRMDERRTRNAAKEEAAIELLKALAEDNLDNPTKDQINTGEPGDYTMEELRAATAELVRRGTKVLPRGERASYVSAADLAKAPDGILISLLGKQVRYKFPGFSPENAGYRRFGDFVRSCPFIDMELGWCTYNPDKTKGEPVYQVSRSKYRSENEAEEAKNQMRTAAFPGTKGDRGSGTAWRGRGSGQGWGPMGYGWRAMRRFGPGRGPPGRGFGARGPPRGRMPTRDMRGMGAPMRAPPPSTLGGAAGPADPNGPGPEIGPVTSSW